MLTTLSVLTFSGLVRWLCFRLRRFRLLSFRFRLIRWLPDYLLPDNLIKLNDILSSETSGNGSSAKSRCWPIRLVGDNLVGQCPQLIDRQQVVCQQLIIQLIDLLAGLPAALKNRTRLKFWLNGNSLSFCSRKGPYE